MRYCRGVPSFRRKNQFQRNPCPYCARGHTECTEAAWPSFFLFQHGPPWKSAWPDARLSDNEYPPAHIVRPAPGVYICRTRLRGNWHAAVCNISEARLCEAYMLGHNEDAYGEVVAVELMEFVRPMRKFSSLEELKTQVDFDKKTARSWFMIRYKSIF